MKLKPLAATIFFAATILPATFSLSAMADDGPKNPETSERPHVEGSHERVEGIQFAVLGGAVVIAIGLAYKVGQTRSKKKQNEGNS